MLLVKNKRASKAYSTLFPCCFLGMHPDNLVFALLMHYMPTQCINSVKGDLHPARGEACSYQ